MASDKSRKRTRWTWVGGVAAVAAAAALAPRGWDRPADAAAIPEPTESARYVVVDPVDALPRVTSLSVAVTEGEGDTPWMTWRAEIEGESGFSVSIALDPGNRVAFPPDVKTVSRYILVPPDGKALEYVDARSGRALLPHFRFAELFLPRAVVPGDGRGTSLPQELVWAGRRFRRDGSAVDLPLPAEIQRLELDPSRLVGNTRSFRDDGRGRQVDAKTGALGDFEWSELSPDDYEALQSAGANLFRVPFAHFDQVASRPVFFLMWEQIGRLPELLLRSNYLGSVMYMDEPAMRLMGRDVLKKSATPQEAAELFMDVVRGRYHGSSGYGSRHLDLVLRRAGYDFGPGEWVQADYPIVDAVPSAAWYGMEAGMQAAVHEGRVQPRWFADLVSQRLGVDFPDDPESGVLFLCAFLRGAARQFDGAWGLAIYGQMEDAAAELAFELSGARGATLFLLWSSDRDHHVPWTRQVELIQAQKARHPRAVDRRPRTEAPIRATTAVVLPYGYLGGEAALTSHGTDHVVGLWGATALKLDAHNGHGATYGDVLAAAYREFAKLLRAREEFDVLFLPAGAPVSTYERVIRIGEDAKVRDRDR